eukprot:TRINITY_DN7858_c0_g7_i2.p1 TRINITY_DN7858_c0_g7~~TRINITY_DN7858_c0_g7_i2.p1  ORF type:complete len:280 (-),score=77.86 TRINITY_DN7858_c0_g7_i2:276-1115(-)
MKASKQEEGEFHYKRGMEAFNKNDYEGAIIEFEQSAALLNDVQSFFRLAQCYSDAKRHKEAMETYERAYNRIESDRPGKAHITILESKAKEEQLLELFDAALSTYGRMLEVGRQFLKGAEFRALEAEVDARKGGLKEARKSSSKRRVQDLIERAKAVEKKGLYESAIELYKSSLLVKETAEGHFRTAECYKKQNKYVEAIEEYEKCNELRKTFATYGDNMSAEAFLQKGICQFELSKLGDAEKSFRQSYSVLPYGNPLKHKIKHYSEIATERSKVPINN